MINLNKPFTCDHCGKAFARESTLIHHMCEPRRRANAQHEPAVKLALRAYQLWWHSLHPRQTIPVNYAQFCQSDLYAAFVRTGAWSLEHQVQQFDAWVAWHTRHMTPVDRWCDGVAYAEYLKDLLQTEPALQALARSLTTAENWSQLSGARWQDLFRKGHPHVLCEWIKQGKISAWMLYNAPSAVEFLHKCTPEQLQIIQTTAPMHLWKIRFLRMSTDSECVRSTLAEAGM